MVLKGRDEEFYAKQIAVVEHHAFMRRLILSMLRGLGFHKLYAFATAEEFLADRDVEDTEVLILDLSIAGDTALSLVARIRHGETAVDKAIPVILSASVTDRETIFDARDAGVTEICTRPMAAVNLYTKLKTSLLAPRRFVISDAYWGPDRRRKDDPKYGGPERRRDYQFDQGLVDQLMSKAETT